MGSSISGTEWSISDWNTINLLDSSAATNKTCNQCLVNKSICGKRAKYEKDDNCYCETHVKKSGYMMPSKSTYPSFLKKQKIGDLHRIAILYNIEGIALTEKRKDLIQKILDFFDRRCLKLIENKQGPNSKKESLISIARSIRDKFDTIETMKGVTDVLIENQISNIASRMTTIQGLLTQYFVMRHDPIVPVNIEFISSRNKLKEFSREDQENSVVSAAPHLDTTPEITKNQKYKSHKTDSVTYTKQILDKYPDCKTKWVGVLETTKKDDLADCFLQGIFI